MDEESADEKHGRNDRSVHSHAIDASFRSLEGNGLTNADALNS